MMEAESILLLSPQLELDNNSKVITTATDNSHFTIEEDDLPRRILLTGLLIDKYYTPLLCLLGAFGNSLSLVVFCMDGKYRKQSSSYYLSALAVSDTGFLLNLFAVWLESMMGGVITSDLTCPLVMYLGQVTCFFSIYLTVAFSLERYIAINFPFSRPRICTRSKARKVIAVIATVALLVFSYAWVIAKVIEIPKMSSSSSSSPESDPGKVEDVSDDASESSESDALFPALLQQQYTETKEERWNHSAFYFDTNTLNLTNVTLDTVSICTVPERYFKISEIANYLDSAVTLVIPFILITFFNIRIAISVCRISRQRQHIVASLISTPSSANLGQDACSINMSTRRTGLENSIKVVSKPKICKEMGNDKNRTENGPKNMENIKGSCMGSDSNTLCGKEKKTQREFTASLKRSQKQQPRMNRSFRELFHQKQQQNPSSSEVRVTKTLLLVSTVFIVLNFPVHAIRCAQFIQNATGSSERGQEILQALQPWVNMLFNTNFATNILIFCMSGSNFKKSLRDIAARILKIKKRPTATNVTETSDRDNRIELIEVNTSYKSCK